MAKPALSDVAKKLRKVDLSKMNALVGLDGFVDLIIDVVDKRTGHETYTRVETIGDLGGRISRAAGLSSNIELVVRQEKLGGNGPIMANAMIEAGVAVTYIGNLGRPAVHPVFADMAKRCKACFSLAAPGTTDALEFRDGKVMMGKHQSLKEVTYERMLEVVGKDKLREVWESSQLIALTNWTMLTAQTDIWKQLHKDMNGAKTRSGAILFTDLADPEKRAAKEIAEAVHFLKKFRKSHRVVLGMNLKESMEIGSAIGLKLKAEEIEGNAAAIRKELDLDGVVIHPTRNAACATEKGSAILDGPYCQNPKLTTGAGDNFNAGFCIGLLAGLEPQEMLASGVANSGFYVRNGRSAQAKDLPAFLEQWEKNYGDPAF
ncbi:MAG TPA: PfkB family carbohydrate kinase [Planctomycetota bacterium]|jgi:sugar/nucleoside kinase (ribokinase family)|nr:PfkB family carbohydrate kinase [Planctomycetota bacterium]